MDVALAGRARRSRGARSGDLHDRFIMPPDERTELTRTLRAAGALTPALLLRSVLGGEQTLLSHALAELSGLPLPRVAAFIFEPQGEGFAALARRAGLKAGVLLAFRAALAAIKAQGAESGDRLKLPLVQKVIDACELVDDPALAKVRALMWRFAAEAAKAEAAHFAREAAASASAGRLPPLLEFSAVNDDSGHAPKLIADFDWPPTGAAMLELAAPRRIRARIKRRASNCRPSLSPGSTTRPKLRRSQPPRWRRPPSPAAPARSPAAARTAPARPERRRGRRK